MSNFVYDDTDLLYPKTNLNPIPAGGSEDNYVDGNAWNKVNQACVDIKTVLRGGDWYGLAENASDPAPAGIDDYVWLDDAGAYWLHLGGVGGTDEQLNGSGSGETNTASNVNTAGVGIYKQKVGVDLEFKGIAAGSSKVSVTNTVGTNSIDVDVVEANIAHQSIGGAGTKDHSAIDTHIGLFEGVAQGSLWVSSGSVAAALAQGTSGQVLTSRGAAADPVWAASALTMQDEGSPLANTPHHTINFIGAGVTAADAGGGVVSVTIPGGSGGLTIGDSIASGTANRILYEDASNQIAEHANFTWDGQTFTVTNIQDDTTPAVFVQRTAASAAGFGLKVTDSGPVGASVGIVSTNLTTGDALRITVDNTMTTGRAIRVLGGAAGATEVFNVDEDGAVYGVNISAGNNVAVGNDLTIASGGVISHAAVLDIQAVGNIALSASGAAGLLMWRTGDISTYDLTGGQEIVKLEADQGPETLRVYSDGFISNSGCDMGSASERWGQIHTTGITVAGDIVPEANNTRSLGGAGSSEWAGVYTLKVRAESGTLELSADQFVHCDGDWDFGGGEFYPTGDSSTTLGKAGKSWSNVHSDAFTLQGSASGTIVQQAAATTTNHTLTWPAALAATTGYLLSSTDAGVLSWAAPPVGGGTLDDAYNAGATITADSGAVTINNSVNDTTSALHIARTVSTMIGGIGVSIVMVGQSGTALDISNAGDTHAITIDQADATGAGISIDTSAHGIGISINDTGASTSSNDLIAISRNTSGVSTGNGMSISLTGGTTGRRLLFGGTADGADIQFSGKSADPTSPADGDFWWNTTDNRLKYRDDSTTRSLAHTGEIGSVTIGEPINSGAANRILYEDSSNNAAESANFTFTGTALALSGGFAITHTASADTFLINKSGSNYGVNLYLNGTEAAAGGIYVRETDYARTWAMMSLVRQPLATGGGIDVDNQGIEEGIGEAHAGLVLRNSTDATALTQQYSPMLVFEGQAYDTSGPTETKKYGMQLKTTGGESAGCNLVWYSGGSTLSTTEQMSLSAGGDLLLAGSITLGGGYVNFATSYLQSNYGIQVGTNAQSSSTLKSAFKVISAAHTGLSNSTGQLIDFDIDAEITYADATTIAEFHGMIVRSPTLDSATATKTITDAATLTLVGAPTVGSANLAITNPYALWVKAGKTKLTGDLEAAAAFEHSGSTFGAFGTTPVAQPVSAADLTNNVTSGGTSDQIDDFTDLSTYATDAAAIRNAIYQLARKLKQVNDGMRDLGLLS